MLSKSSATPQVAPSERREKKQSTSPLDTIRVRCGYCGKTGTARECFLSDRETFCTEIHGTKFWSRIVLVNHLVASIINQICALHQRSSCTSSSSSSKSRLEHDMSLLKDALLDEFKKHTLYLNSAFSDLLCLAATKKLNALLPESKPWIMREIVDQVEMDLVFPVRARGPASYFLLLGGVDIRTKIIVTSSISEAVTVKLDASAKTK